MIGLTFSERYMEDFPELSFGVGVIRGCSFFERQDDFKHRKRKLLRKMRSRSQLEIVRARVDLYDRFFEEYGFKCPLPGHLKHTIHRGFPFVNVYIDIHIMVEMCHGLLVAIGDLDRFQGDWILDLAERGESFKGVNDKPILCKKGEIVLRDEVGIVCSLFQGPDYRTRVRRETYNVVLYTFMAPGIPREAPSEGLDLGLGLLEEFARGVNPEKAVFHPNH